MKFILLPVKDLRRAKQRLAALLTQPERTELARRMMAHTFAQVAAARGADGVAVVTNYEPAIILAQQYGFDVINETEQVSESVSVDYGSRVLAGRGVRAVLRLPLDLPLLVTEDIELLLSRIPAPQSSAATVIVPSRDGTGTNAIARTPPDLFPSHFGPHSLSKHLAEAATCKADCQVIELPRIAFDLDDPGDLTHLLAEGRGGCLADYLRELQMERRLTADANR